MRSIVLAVVLLLPLTSVAQVDPRAEVRVQASPLECAAVWSRLQDVKAESEAQSDAAGRIGKACDFEKIAATVAKLGAAKKAPVDADFPGPRAPRAIARDALDQVVAWLVPTKERPIAFAQDAVFRRLRFEFREVLAGRDPYAAK
jgi:hypothetical protein